MNTVKIFHSLVLSLSINHAMELNKYNNKFILEAPEATLQVFPAAILKNSFENAPALLKQNFEVLNVGFNYRLDAYQNFKTFPKRVLFYGPSGTGKTTLAYALAYRYSLPFIFVKSSSLADSYKDSSMAILDTLFSKLNKPLQKGLIIFDEITAFTKRFENPNDSNNGAVEHLWSLLDELQKKNTRLIVVGTCNDIKKVPETIIDRFRNNKFEISFPNFAQRKSAIETLLRGYEIDSITIDQLTEHTQSLGLREINACLSQATVLIDIQSIENKESEKTYEFFRQFFNPVKEDRDNAWYEKYKEKAWNATVYLTPIIASVAVAGITLYFQQQNNAENKTLQTLFHKASLALQESLSKLQLKQSSEQFHLSHELAKKAYKVNFLQKKFPGFFIEENNVGIADYFEKNN